MTRAAFATLLVATAVLAAGAGGAPAGPAQPTFRSVIVTLQAQADLHAIRGPRASRLSQVVNALRAKSTITQRALRFRLAVLRAQRKVTKIQPLWVTNALAVTATDEVVAELSSRPDVLSVLPDAETAAPQGTVLTSLASPAQPSVARAGAPQLWTAGLTGQGVVVASIDTGVSLTHPELSSRWRGGSNSWYDPNGQHGTPYDSSGHGSYTTGVMVAGDASSTALGIAPDARWIAAKIFNDRGSASVSAIHLAYQWLLDPDHNPATADAPDVINNSWGNSYPGCDLTFDTDLRGLRAAGILPIFAAGNTGPGASSSISPANTPAAFAVGATTSDDQVYVYSARGPSACGEPSGIFPEIVAPGVSVRTTDRYGGYVNATGTSMAAPAAAGVLALLLQAYPDLTVAQQESALEAAFDLGTAGPDNTFGRGRLDAAAALASIGPPPPPTPDFTIGSVPASTAVDPGGGAAYTITVAAVNGFADSVALTVSGLPAGASASFAPAQLTSGSSQLTVTTSASTPPGEYPLTITGTSGGLSHQTVSALVVNQPPPPPDFTLGVAPSSVSVTRGTAATYTVSSSGTGGFAADVALSATGLPPEVSTVFSPQSIVGGTGSSQLTLSTSAAMQPGTYSVTITGVSGSLQHVASATLVVSAPPTAQTLHPTAVTVETGSSPSGSAASLAADDALYYVVGASTGLTRVASWYGTFTGVAGMPASLEVRYKGRVSALRGQAISIWNWATSSWVQLDFRNVGPTEVFIGGLAPPGSPSSYISAGSVKVRIRVTGSYFAGGFTSSGNLLELVAG